MAQPRVTDYFSTRKRNPNAQPGKRRKVEITTANIGISSVESSNDLNTKATFHPRLAVDARPENVVKMFTPPRTRSGKQATKSTARKARGTGKKPVEKKQRSIKDVLGGCDEAAGSVANQREETTLGDQAAFSWDEHDGPPLTPTKSAEPNGAESVVKSRGRKRTCQGQSKIVDRAEKDATPEKQLKTVTIKSSRPKSKKKLAMDEKETVSLKESPKESIPMTPVKIPVELLIPKTPPPISPLPPTPKKAVQEDTKRPVLSPKVKKAMEACKMLLKAQSAEQGSKSKEAAASDSKLKLSRCGNLEDLKKQLSQFKDAKAKLDKPVPKLKKFDKIEVQVETPSSVSESSKIEPETKTAPAYERFHSLATPAPPTLSLPYKYKLLAEIFRSMDTVVSMLHNRMEICTYSKLKAAVQEMTKRNFETSHIGQVRTVFPTAYHLRQEKGLPMFGNKSSGYQLTVEANLDSAETRVKVEPGSRLTFTAQHLLQRKGVFHNNLINIVKKHHKEFLSKLQRPLDIPDDKITRWHPKFPLDQVPNVECAALPEPPSVQLYRCAKDVLESNQGKLIPRVEQALAAVAKENTLSDSKVTVNPKVAPAPGPAVKGIPQSLLEKIRAKEAKKMEMALTRDPQEDKKNVMIGRLPDMMRILRTHFVTEKKPCLPMDAVVQKLADSYRSVIAPGDVEVHVNLMMELTPEWLSVVQIKKGRYLKLDKNMDLQTLTDKVKNIAKARK